MCFFSVLSRWKQLLIVENNIIFRLRDKTHKKEEEEEEEILNKTSLTAFDENFFGEILLHDKTNKKPNSST